MSLSSPERNGGGLDDADVERIFMEENFNEPEELPEIPKSEAALHQKDFKKAAAGERDDDIEFKPAGQAAEPPTFEEPWPEPPEDSPIEETPEPQKQSVESPAKDTGRRQLNLFPSDNTWSTEIKKIFRKDGA